MDDVVLNKAAAIERCIARVHQEHAGDDRNLLEDLTKQDSIILNIQRACEAAIDLAMHLVRRGRLGIPQESREAFDLLAGAGQLDRALAGSMKKMVGFRNIAVHDYQKLNIEIVRAIIGKQLPQLQQFAAWALKSFA